MSYSIICELGRGGMGSVYKAKDSNGKIVALKMMSNKVSCYPEYRRLFASEVDSLRRMNHPSVVHIIGEPYSDSEGNYYLPMEFIEGETIEQRVAKQGPFAVDAAVALMSGILEALQYIHNRGRIHRDIKPSNIMVRPDGSVCIIDFGIAKDARIGGTGHTVGHIIGTDGYMSPEQAKGFNIDHRTDIYSVGCVFYYLLTGQHAIVKAQNDFATVANILKGQMPHPSQTNPNVPTEVDDVFLKAVDMNMMNRYATASEFKEALGEIGAHHVPSVRIGSSAENDIVLKSQYVSRRHLVIKGLEQTTAEGITNHSIEITDMSMNGTGVNGAPLRHGSIVVEYNGTASLPEVLLAARSECALNWNEVVGLLKAKGWHLESVLTPDSPRPAPAQESLSAFLAIVSFLFPLIGWILWGVWRHEHPKKATTASIVAWIGFFFNIIVTFALN